MRNKLGILAASTMLLGGIIGVSAIDSPDKTEPTSEIDTITELPGAGSGDSTRER